MNMTIIKKIKEDNFYLKSNAGKEHLKNINLEETKEMSIYISEHQMFNSQHHYIINNVMYNLKEENKSIFLNNISFSYNMEAHIHIDKIIGNKEWFNMIDNHKKWFEESFALHYMIDVKEKIKLTEKYEVDLNIKNREGHPLIICIVPPDDFYVNIDPKDYVEFIVKNKEKINFLIKDPFEQNVIEKVIKILRRTKKQSNSDIFLNMFGNMLNELQDKKIIINESFLYKNSDFYFMQLAMKFNILNLDKTGNDIENIHEEFLNNCIMNHFIETKHFNKIDEFEEELKVYKLKKIIIEENKLLKTHIEKKDVELLIKKRL